jgi:phosphoribosyl 1,2-cyclic phosphodiesterase
MDDKGYVRVMIHSTVEGVRVDFVGDRASLPEVLAAMPRNQSVEMEQIKRDAQVLERRIGSDRDLGVSHHRLQFSLALICAVVAMAFVFVSCGGKSDERNQNRVGTVDVQRFYGVGV